MRFYEVSRRELQSLSRAGELVPPLLGERSIGDRNPPAPGNCLLVCQEEPRLRITALVTRESERVDFLAWVATYLSSYRPVTAHFHVLTTQLLNQLLSARAPKIESRTIAGFAGAILGEALLTWPKESAAITIGKCRSTRSFALARGVVLGIPEAVRSEGTEERWRWVTPRRPADLNGNADELELPVLSLASSPELRLSVESIGRLNRDIVAACEEIRARGEISKERLRFLMRRLPVGLEVADSVPESTREIKVSIFERFRNLIHDAGSHLRDRDATIAFMLGYLASRVAPGSLEHFRLLGTQEERYSAAIVWYGLFAGLHPESEVLERSPVARRIARDLQLREPILDTPRGDVALFELHQMSVSRAFAPYLDGPIEVEVVPGVLCRSDRSSTSQAAGRDLNEIATEIGAIVHRLERIQQRVGSVPSAGKDASGHGEKKGSARRGRSRE